MFSKTKYEDEKIFLNYYYIMHCVHFNDFFFFLMKNRNFHFFSVIILAVLSGFIYTDRPTMSLNLDVWKYTMVIRAPHPNAGPL